MSNDSSRQLLSVGVFFIAVVVAILLWATNLIDWTLTFPVVMLVFGCWMLALAAMQSNKPIKYAQGPFGTAALGVALIAVGGGWFLLSITGNILYALALVLIVVAALAIAAALRHK
jgi:hypothetical protein